MVQRGYRNRLLAPKDELALLADAHLQARFTDEEIRIMAVENTRRLAGA
jgi:hypothetical protein